jgi:hypothetical protein
MYACIANPFWNCPACPGRSSRAMLFALVM